MLEKGPRRKGRPATRPQRRSICRCGGQPLAAFSPSPAPVLTEAEKSPETWVLWGIKLTYRFTVGATIMKFGTHMDHG